MSQLSKVLVFLALEFNHELLLLPHHLIIGKHVHEEAVGLASLPLQLLPHRGMNEHGLVRINAGLRGLRFLKDEHSWYALSVDAVGHHLGPGHAWLVPAIIVHCPCLLRVLVPDEAKVVLPNKTDQADRGVGRDR